MMVTMTDRRALGHFVEVEPGRTYFTVRCLWHPDCDFGGERGDRVRFKTRTEARDAADAHMLFTHVTGGHRCGEPGCHVDQVILRIKRSSDDGA